MAAQYWYQPAGSPGDAPSGLSAHFGSSISSLSIQDASGTAILRHLGTGGSNRATIDAVAADVDRATVEGYAVVRASSATNRYLLGYRLQDAATNGYIVRFTNSTTLALSRLTSGSISSIQTASFSWSLNTWYALRVQASGNSHKVKIWAYGSAEPETWQISATETSYPGAGGVGPCGNTGTGINTDWLNIGVGTGGQAAPTSAPSSGIDLEGAASVALAAAGELTTAVLLDATPTVDVSSSGQLTTQITLSGDALANMDAGAGLTAQVTLQGAAIAQALASAGLSTGVSLEGNASAAASASGNLAMPVQLAATAIISGEATGNLTTVVRLGGAAASVSSATGNLTANIRLNSQATAAAAASGLLAAAAADLAGDGSAQSAASGSLTLRFQISAAAVASAQAISSLSTGIRLAGAASAVARAQGLLEGTGVGQAYATSIENVAPAMAADNRTPVRRAALA